MFHSFALPLLLRGLWTGLTFCWMDIKVFDVVYAVKVDKINITKDGLRITFGNSPRSHVKDIN